MIRRTPALSPLVALALAATLGCTTSDDDFGGDDDNGDDDAVDCTDYRTAYPDGEHGTSVGDILGDFPGMVDGTGATQHLEGYYLDTSLLVLVIANAFDT